MSSMGVSSSISGASGQGGPGPVSGGYSGITSGGTGAMSSGMMTAPATSNLMSGGENPGGYPASSGAVGSNSNGGAGPSTTTGSTPSSTGPACPHYDGERYTDSQGSTYSIDCNATYLGTVIFSSDNSSSTYAKRQAVGFTEQSCMAYCDETAECVAINFDCNDVCTLLGSTSSIPVQGPCGVAARRLSGPSSAGGNSVITVTVCAAGSGEGTTTVFTTATRTTCPANAQCTAGSAARSGFGKFEYDPLEGKR